MVRGKTAKKSMKKTITKRGQKKWGGKSRKQRKMKKGGAEPCLAAYLAKYHNDDGSQYKELQEQFATYRNERKEWEKENPGYAHFIKTECN